MWSFTNALNTSMQYLWKQEKKCEPSSKFLQHCQMSEFSIHIYFEESQNSQEPFWFWNSDLYSSSISDFTFTVSSLQLNRRISIPWERKKRKGIGKYKQKSEIGKCKQIASGGEKHLMSDREKIRGKLEEIILQILAFWCFLNQRILQKYICNEKDWTKIGGIWGHSWCCWVLLTKPFLPRIRTVGTMVSKNLRNNLLFN